MWALYLFLYLLSFVIVIAVQVVYIKLKLSYKFASIREISNSFGKDSQLYGHRFRDDLMADYSREFSRLSYCVPLVLLLLIMATGNFFLFFKLFQYLRFGGDESIFKNIPSELLFGYLGGYSFVLYSIFNKYHSSDLNPISYLMFSFQLPLAAILGYLICIPLESSYDFLAAFAVGTVPVPQLMSFMRGYAENKLGLKNPEQEAISDLFQIQGLRKSHIDRLADQDILTVQNLAFCNPFKLYLLTNFTIKLIIDWVDQALLIIYVNDTDRLHNLRKIGIRGAIELLVCKYMDESAKKGLEKKLIEILHLANRDTLLRLLDDLDENDHIRFIWEARRVGLMKLSN